MNTEQAAIAIAEFMLAWYQQGISDTDFEKKRELTRLLLAWLATYEK